MANHQSNKSINIVSEINLIYLVENSAYYMADVVLLLTRIIIKNINLSLL